MPEKTDVLAEIPANKFEQLLEIIARELPASIYPYQFLQTVYNWRKNDPSYDVTIFWCTEKIESGIFVALLRTGNKTCGLFFYAAEGYDALLEQVLLKNEKIDWEELPLIEGIMPRHYSLAENVVKAKNFVPKIYVDTTVQYLDPNIASSYQIECPSEVSWAPLTSAEINCIYDHWPHHDVYTRDDIRYPVEQGISFGLFSRSSRELLAWVMQSHYGAIGMLYTKENFRRRGYAKLLVKLMAKELTKNSILPYAMIMASNARSISLFHSIGFKQIIPMRYIAVCNN